MASPRPRLRTGVETTRMTTSSLWLLAEVSRPSPPTGTLQTWPSMTPTSCYSAMKSENKIMVLILCVAFSMRTPGSSGGCRLICWSEVWWWPGVGLIDGSRLLYSAAVLRPVLSTSVPRPSRTVGGLSCSAAELVVALHVALLCGVSAPYPALSRANWPRPRRCPQPRRSATFPHLGVPLLSS